MPILRQENIQSKEVKENLADLFLQELDEFRVEIGEYLRKKRKESGLKQEDLEAKAHISASTVSNIEHGRPHVQKEKLEAYANIFNLSLRKILQHLKETNEEDALIARELSHIETKIDRVKPDIILKSLNNVKVTNQAHAWYCYLLGKAHFNKKKYHKAFDNFQEAVHFIDEHPELLETNLKACCYKEIGRVLYFQNQLNKALEFNQLGIDCYQENGQRQWISHYLAICKAIYLEKLEKVDEALNALEELWKEKDQIKSLEVVLNMIELRALILKKTSLYDKATKYAIEGISL
jgi:transcriptional regulator with XRE-family HTH domain